MCLKIFGAIAPYKCTKIKNLFLNKDACLILGLKYFITFAPGEMAEWSIAAVLKTVEGQTSGGSNPSFSAG